MEQLTECVVCGANFCGMENCPTTCLCDGVYHIMSISKRADPDIYNRVFLHADVVCLSDQENVYLSVSDHNRLVQTVTGQKADTLKGKTCSEIIAKESADQIKEMNYSVFKTMAYQDIVITTTFRDKKKMTLSLEKSPLLTLNDEPLILTCAYDLSKFKVSLGFPGFPS